MIRRARDGRIVTVDLRWRRRRLFSVCRIASEEFKTPEGYTAWAWNVPLPGVVLTGRVVVRQRGAA